MKTFQLALRELSYRRWTAVAGIIAIALATGVVGGTINLLKTYRAHSRAQLAAMQAELEQRVAVLDEDIRGAMDILGFNLVIVPAGQNLGNYYADDYAETSMPETKLERLARADIESISHILPRLRWRIHWPETKWTVILLGTAEQAMTLEDGPADPVFRSSAPGQIQLGYEIHTALGYTTGQVIRIMGREYEVAECAVEQGTSEDISIWMNLDDTQTLLGKQGEINEIMALATEKAVADFNLVRAEITTVLADTQVIIRQETVTAMTAARRQTIERGRATIAAEAATAAERQRSVRGFALLLVPIVLVLAVVWLGYLMLDNVRDRTAEIGILSALGYRRRQVVCLFLTRAGTAALAGGILGFIMCGISGTYSFKILGTVLGTAAGVTIIATAGPVLYTLLMNPADILRKG